MSWLKSIFVFCRSWFRDRRIKPEIDEELRFHVETVAEQNVKTGMEPEEARHRALRQFGKFDRIKEICRDIRGVGLADAFAHDLRYAVRLLLKNPGFTTVALLTLSLGIGINTAMFSIFNSLLLRTVTGTKEPERLVAFDIPKSQAGKPLPYFSYPDWVDFQKDDQVFEGIAAYDNLFANLKFDDKPQRIQGQLVSGNYFEVLGIRPVAGRAFLPEESTIPGAHPVVVISQFLWQRYFDEDRSIVGKIIRINNCPFTVIGVVPFFRIREGPMTPEFWVPVMMHDQLRSDSLQRLDRFGPADTLADRGRGWLQWIGRLREGIPLRQAQAAVAVMAKRLGDTYPKTMMIYPVTVVGLAEYNQQLLKEVLPVGVVFLAFAGLVLLIACANLANLLLARVVIRRQELAVRLALGAGRWRLVRQLLAESLSLVACASLGGIVFTLWASALLEWFLFSVSSKTSFPFRIEINVDTEVLAYAVLLSMFTGLVFGLVPAIRASKTDLAPIMKGETGMPMGGVRRFTFRNALVVGQVAVCLMLLIVAGLFARGLQKAHTIDMGFSPAGVLTMPIDLKLRKLPETQSKVLFRQVVERVKNVPAVQFASLAQHCQGDESFTSVFCQTQGVSTNIHVYENVVSEDYFHSLKIPILHGRGFDPQNERGEPVVIINEALARLLWPGEHAVGKQLRIHENNSGIHRSAWVEVVGVAKTGKYLTLRERDRLFLYRPVSQKFVDSMNLVVRTGDDARRLLPVLRRELAAVDDTLPVYELKLMQDKLAIWLLLPQLGAILVGVIGVLALFLSLLGLYGVIAHVVSQRTKEFGIRVALGAQAGDVVRLVMRQGGFLVLIGSALGLAGALASTRVIASLLFGIGATDPIAFIGVSLLLIFVAMLACYIPARRATKLNPVVTLRHE